MPCGRPAVQTPSCVIPIELRTGTSTKAVLVRSNNAARPPFRCTVTQIARGQGIETPKPGAPIDPSPYQY